LTPGDRPIRRVVRLWTALLTPLQQCVLRFADDVVANVRASDATFSPLQAELAPRPLVEPVVAIGFYMAACRVLATFDIDVHA
jgi:hypothetical protein